MVLGALQRGTSGTRHTIIISGESGAGKTEATKILLNFLVASASEDEDRLAANARLRERLLAANPLLEAVGNARTKRNDNSSRFGKMIEVRFSSERGALNISGARIINYLLEKTRLSKPPPGERNFHILYQLAACAREGTSYPQALTPYDGLPSDLLDILPWRRPEDIKYLGGGGWEASDAQAEAAAFRSTCACLDAIGVGAEGRAQLFSMLTAILLVGNLSFASNDSSATDEGGEGCFSSDVVTQRKLSKLMGVPSSALAASLCRRRFAVRNQNVVHKEQNTRQANDARDALARALYNGVFEWLLAQLNQTIGGAHAQKGGSPTSAVGLLDIYGFECFEANSFEQLLINYANEKLQRLFNTHVFELEQIEYRKEGIEWVEIEWQDNQSTLELIDARPSGVPGILSALDDATWRTADGDEADSNLLHQLHASFSSAAADGGHASYVRPKFGAQDGFGVRHYAGEVFYDVRGFAQKNVESLSEDVHDLLRSSTHAWLVENIELVLKGPMPTTSAAASDAKPALTSRVSRLRQASVGEQFRTQLHELISVIGTSANDVGSRVTPHAFGAAADSSSKAAGALTDSTCAYVRCVKSNSDRRPWHLDRTACSEQLVHLGMMEAVRIRKQSFATRHGLADFVASFGRLLRCNQLPAAAATAGGSREAAVALTESLATALAQPESTWQVGTSKVFVREPFASKLGAWATVFANSACTTLQRAMRAFVHRRKENAAGVITRAWTVHVAVERARSLRVQKQQLARAVRTWAGIVAARAVQDAAAGLMQRVTRGYLGRSKSRHKLQLECAAAIAAANKAMAAAAAAESAFVSPPRFVGPGHRTAVVAADAADVADGQGRPPLGDVSNAELSSPNLIRALCSSDEALVASADKNAATAAVTTAQTPSRPAVVTLSQVPTGGLENPTPVPHVKSMTPVPPAQLPPTKPAKPAGRTVAQLNAPVAVCIEGTLSMREAATRMLDGRCEALLVFPADTEGGGEKTAHFGILTATDIAKKVVAAGLPLGSCVAKDVMTSTPHTVASTDPAADALTAMMSGSFRHVPVVCGVGEPPALLDLMRCLFDVIVVAERAHAAGEALIDAVSRGAAHGASGSQGADPMADVLAPALRSLLAPSLESLSTTGESPRVVTSSCSVREAAAELLRPGVTAVLVRCDTAISEEAAEEQPTYDLFTPRSLLKLLASEDAGSSIGEQPVSAACCGEPPLMPPRDASVIDALHMLQAERRTHALLLSASGAPMALLDVLQLVRESVSHAERSADAQELHDFCGAAAALEGEARGAPRSSHGSSMTGDEEGSTVGSLTSFCKSRFVQRGEDGATLVSFVDDGVIRPEDSISMVGGMDSRPATAETVVAQKAMMRSHGPSRHGGVLLIKLHDEESGNVHRVHCSPQAGWFALRDDLEARLHCGLRAIVWADDEGDLVAIDSDASLREAASHSLGRGEDRLTVTPVRDDEELESPSWKQKAALQRPTTSAQHAAALTARQEALKAQREREQRQRRDMRARGNAKGHGGGRRQNLAKVHEEPSASAVSTFLGGLIAASSIAVGAGIVLAAKAARR